MYVTSVVRNGNLTDKKIFLSLSRAKCMFVSGLCQIPYSPTKESRTRRGGGRSVWCINGILVLHEPAALRTTVSEDPAGHPKKDRQQAFILDCARARTRMKYVSITVLDTLNEGRSSFARHSFCSTNQSCHAPSISSKKKYGMGIFVLI